MWTATRLGLLTKWTVLTKVAHVCLTGRPRAILRQAYCSMIGVKSSIEASAMRAASALAQGMFMLGGDDMSWPFTCLYMY